MKKTKYILLAMMVMFALWISACGGSAAPATQAAVQQPPAVVDTAPSQAVVVEVVPTQPLATVQSFAPACQAAASCAAPAVTDTVASDRYCVEKVPYQNILVDSGVTFEVLDPSKLTCADNGTMVDGKHVVECHGTESWASQVKFINTACSANSLTTGTGQCQEGLGYDAANNCCSPLTAGDSGSVTITVNMGECPN